MKKISVAKTIMAILWITKGATLKTLEKHPYFATFSKDKSKKTLASSLTRLKKAGFISIKGRHILLAPEGTGDALEAHFNVELLTYLQKKLTWDGKWRMVFFDIPEHKRQYRDYLRKILKLIGFKEFQRSIWIYPFHAPSFLKNLLLKEDLRGHVRFITTEHIDNDQDLRLHFKLL